MVQSAATAISWVESSAGSRAEPAVRDTQRSPNSTADKASERFTYEEQMALGEPSSELTSNAPPGESTGSAGASAPRKGLGGLWGERFPRR